MRAVVLNKPGSLEELRYVEDRPIPVPGKGEIRVKVHCVGLNPVDYKLADGWGGVNWGNPPVLGLDVAGTVDALGDGVTGFSTGDRVYYHGNLSKENGGFAEFACTAALTVSFMPDGLKMETAAAIPCSGFTAYQAVVNKLKVREGNTILVHAGAGGVGGYAIQLAKLKGLKVFSTCSTGHIDYVKGLGADCVIDYTKEDVYGRIMEETDQRGVDYIVNTIDGETATRDVDILAFNGELAAIVEHPDFSRLRFYEKAMSLHEVALGGAHLNGDLKARLQLAEIGNEFARLVVEGKVKPLKMELIAITEIPAYLARLKERHVAGKIVAKVYDAK